MVKKNLNLITFLLLIITLFLNGCASPMALKKGMTSVDTSQESVVVFSLQLANDNSGPKWYPYPKEVWFWSDDMRNDRRKGFNLSDARCITGRGNFCTRLISVRLNPGDYTLTGIIVLASGLSGTAEGYVPIYLPLQVRANEIVYIGNIEAVNRKRSKGDLAAGAIFPLLPQQSSGFAKGTFDVQVFDNYDEDILLLEEAYPVLSEHEVKKRLLPQWEPPMDWRVKERWINP